MSYAHNLKRCLKHMKMSYAHSLKCCLQHVKTLTLLLYLSVALCNRRGHVSVRILRAASVRNDCVPCSFVLRHPTINALSHTTACVRRLQNRCNSSILLFSYNSVLRKRPVVCCCGCVIPRRRGVTTDIAGCLHCSLRAFNGRSVRANRTMCSG